MQRAKGGEGEKGEDVEEGDHGRLTRSLREARATVGERAVPGKTICFRSALNNGRVVWRTPTVGKVRERVWDMTELMLAIGVDIRIGLKGSIPRHGVYVNTTVSGPSGNDDAHDVVVHLRKDSCSDHGDRACGTRTTDDYVTASTRTVSVGAGTSVQLSGAHNRLSVLSRPRQSKSRSSFAIPPSHPWLLALLRLISSFKLDLQ